MSGLDLSAAVEVAYRTYCEALHGGAMGDGDFEATRSSTEFEWLRLAVSDAAPLIEAAVREQVAAEIEAQRDAEIATAKPHVCDDADQGMCHTTAAFTASSMAARIARGITP